MGISRQAACKEHEWDLCVSVKFSLLFGIWNRFSMHSAVRLFHHPSSWWIQIAPSRKSLKSISHLSVQCSMCVSHTSKILPTLLWASSLEQHDHHKHRRKFEMFRVYNVHACCVCSQSRSLLSFSFFFREVSNSFSILSLLLYPPLCLLIFPRMSLFLYSFQ